MISLQKNHQKKIIVTLNEAEKNIAIAHQLVNRIYPAFNDPKILLKALRQAYKAELFLISTTLQLAHIRKKIRLRKDPQKNQELFFKKVARLYELQSKEIRVLKNLLIRGENLSKSGCTFPQPGKAMILNDDGTINEVSPATLKNEISALQDLLKALKTSISHPRKI